MYVGYKVHKDKSIRIANVRRVISAYEQKYITDKSIARAYGQVRHGKKYALQMCVWYKVRVDESTSQTKMRRGQKYASHKSVREKVHVDNSTYCISTSGNE